MLRSNLYDYSDVYTVIEIRITHHVGQPYLKSIIYS